MIFLLLTASLVSAYSFVFSSKPQQCANVSFDITGSGVPPYSLLLIPYGPTPLLNNVEVRTIVSQQFPTNATSVSLQLNYPADSQFVALVSDASGFGSGGTSGAATVQNSSDTSCFNANQTVSPNFPYNIDPPNQVVQCAQSRLWWNSSQVQGTVSFHGVIPGGQSFSIPLGTLSNVNNKGTGFDWTPTVRAGTTLLVIAGDDRGLGTGGSTSYDVSAGLYPNSSCITNISPSSTAGSPAGGSYPTNASGGMSTTEGTSNSNNTAAIVGGVIGGLAAIVILGLTAFYVIRRKTAPNLGPKERPVDLLHGDDDPDDPPSSYQPPPYLQPEPYLVTSPTNTSFSPSQYSPVHEEARFSMAGSDIPASSAYGTSTSLRRQSAMTSLSDPAGGSTPGLELGVLSPAGSPAAAIASTSSVSGHRSTSWRKSAGVAHTRQLRAVNIIQHEDAGPSGARLPSSEEIETIEIPPAYTHIRKDQTPPA